MFVTLSNQSISEVLKYRISSLTLRADDILHIDIKGEETFTIADYYDLMDGAFKLGGGKQLLNLITMGKYTLPDHAARVLSTSIEGGKYKLADAFVINSLPQKIIGNFYMKYHKPYTPTQFFNDEIIAVNWLNNQRKQFSENNNKSILYIRSL